MSRTIDPEKISSGKLTEDELLYLAQRDMLPADVREDYETQEEIRRRLEGIRPMLADIPNTGDANTRGITLAQLEAMGLELLDDGLNPPRQFQSARLGDTIDDIEGMEEEEEEDDDDLSEVPYTDKRWTNDRLRAEIAGRNEDRDEAAQLSLEGKKEDLIRTLEADDES